MSPSHRHIPRHVFLSYPRIDRGLAERILNDLDGAGFQIWIDDQGIEPGTANWERQIRQAVAEAYAVVLLCTPNTASAPYVPAELQLAQSRECRIIPIWMDGEKWIECVPLGISNSQYIDARGERYSHGLKSLSTQLHKERGRGPKLALVNTLKECPSDRVPIIFAKHADQPIKLVSLEHEIRDWRFLDKPLPDDLQVLAVMPQAYTHFEELLEDIFTGFLTQRYKPYTYGKDWVIVKPNRYISLLAVPWFWLRETRAKALIDAVPNYTARRTPLLEYGFGRDSVAVWAIVDEGFENACGLFTPNTRIAEQAFKGSSKFFRHTIDKCLWNRPLPGDEINADCVRLLHEIDDTKYPYKLVIASGVGFESLPQTNGTVIVIDE